MFTNIKHSLKHFFLQYWTPYLSVFHLNDFDLIFAYLDIISKHDSISVAVWQKTEVPRLFTMTLSESFDFPEPHFSSLLKKKRRGGKKESLGASNVFFIELWERIKCDKLVKVFCKMKHLIQVLVNGSDKIGFFSWFAHCRRDNYVFYVFIQLMDSNVKQTMTKILINMP